MNLEGSSFVSAVSVASAASEDSEGEEVSYRIGQEQREQVELADPVPCRRKEKRKGKALVFAEPVVGLFEA